jgi:hypothetical protein
MRYGSLVGAMAVAALCATIAGAQAWDDTKYPKGQWERIGDSAFDASKPLGRGQQPPLTAEYRTMLLAHGGTYRAPRLAAAA